MASQTLMQLASEDSDLTHFQRERLQDALQFMESSFDGLGFCLSKRGDVLSQWRGYANDATGLSIGFSEEYLRAYCQKTSDEQTDTRLRLDEVEYESTKHVELVNETYQAVRVLIKDGAFDYTRGLGLGLLESRTAEELAKDKAEVNRKSFAALLRLYGLLPKLFSFKSDAFKEEEELRLISNMASSPELNVERHCLFRNVGNQVVPYREVQLQDLGMPRINKVFLGPKHQTPKAVIKMFLEENGFNGVEVVESSASYR